MLWRIALVFGFVLGMAAFAYQIGSRLSDEAVMTLMGVVCGIVAGIPVSIGLIIALTRERGAHYEDEADDAYYEPSRPNYSPYRPASPLQPQAPQIIVVAPPQGQFAPTPAGYPNYLLPPASAASAPMQERSFKIVGEDEGE